MALPDNAPRLRKSLAFSASDNVENVQPSLIGRKRSKSLGGSEDVTLPSARKRKIDGVSSIPTAPRGILKPSFASNDDNHTVIGVMQVALKEEPISKSVASRSLNRRVSFAPEATLHTFDIDRDDLQSMSSMSAASTPMSETENQTPSATVPDSHSPLSAAFQRSGPTSPLQQIYSRTPPRVAANYFVETDDESEVEMEDATDVFDDIFEAASASKSERKSSHSPAPVAQPQFTTSFFSPLRSQTPNSVRPESGSIEDDGNQTMDLTTAVGNILENTEEEQDASEDDNAEQTMEVTKAVGWIANEADDQTMDISMEEENVVNAAEDTTVTATMDITMAVGSIKNSAHNSITQQDEGEDDTGFTMELTRAFGSIETGADHEEDDDNTGVTMDVTRALGSIEQAVEKDDGEDDTGITMDITRAIGSIQASGEQDEEMTSSSIAMDVTIAVGKVQVSPLTNSQSPVVKTLGTPVRAGRLTPQRSGGTPQSSRSLRREPSIIGLQTPTRMSLVSQNVASSASLQRQQILRRRSLLDEQVPTPAFDGNRISIGTPEGQKLKTDIDKTLFSFSTSSLQKRIQSLTPKKLPRTPVVLPASSSRKEALESLKSEEQEALAKIFSPLKAVSASISPAKVSSTAPVRSARPLSHMDIPVLDLGIPKIAGTSSQKPRGIPDELSEDDAAATISLNDFLRLTSVQFLEGLNTKRRNTKFFNAQSSVSEPTFDATVLARYLDSPNLELLEFSCRELRKNIEEGNELFDRLESETLEENPPLFKRYLQLSLDGQAAFCAQFKIIKSFARLQSKGIWYEWRSKLLNGILASLAKNTAMLKEDCAALSQMEEKVMPVVSDIKTRYSNMKGKLDQLAKRKHEVEDCNQEQLNSIREQLAIAEVQVEDKRAFLEKLVDEDSTLTASIATHISGIKSCEDDVAAQERIIEQNQSIDTSQIKAVKDELLLIRQVYKWEILKVDQNVIVLCYDNDLELGLSLAAKEVQILSCRRSVPPVTDFFLRAIRDISRDSLGSRLRDISILWQLQARLNRELKLLSSHYIHETTIADDLLVVKVEVLLPKSRTKVNVFYKLKLESGSVLSPVTCESSIQVVYGKLDDGNLSLPQRLDMMEEGLLRRGCDEICLRV